MLCANCFKELTSDKHQKECQTIKMFQLKQQNLPLKNKMMTYGLGGCTAIILIDKECNRVIFGHHPNKNIVLKWFMENFTNPNNKYILIIKLPGEYIINNFNKYDLKGTEEKFWNQNIPKNDNLKIIFEPYNLNTSIQFNQKYTFNYNSTLYLRQNKDLSLEYNDTYGRWIKI